MKKENDEITNLFRSRLNDVEVPVRDGFWEELNQGLATCHHRRLMFFRLTAAASVLLVLAASSAAFWYFSPKEDLEEAFTQIAVANGGTLDGDVVKQVTQPVQHAPILPKKMSRQLAAYTPAVKEDNDSVSVTVSMSFSFSVNSTVRQHNNPMNHVANEAWQNKESVQQTGTSVEQESTRAVLTESARSRSWALKMALGSSLAAGKYQMPVVGQLTVERQLTKHLAIESGLRYSYIDGGQKGLHYIGIPLQMNVTLAKTNKMNLYALVGGVADKCIAGAANNNFKNEPIQLAVMGGVGVGYKLNDKVALFAEPTVVHHFRTDSKHETVRTERPTNVNLICGVRMTY
ncbi:MAG: porin family protein [Bacteroides sp.]